MMGTYQKDTGDNLKKVPMAKLLDYNPKYKYP